MMLDGRLFIAPIPTDPQRILDVGTGTGIWGKSSIVILPVLTVILAPTRLLLKLEQRSRSEREC